MTADRLAVSVGVELLRLVPGFVPTEVDANLSFIIAASVARARQIIDAYKRRDRKRMIAKCPFMSSYAARHRRRTGRRRAQGF